MHDTLRNALAIEVRQFFNQVMVLHQDRTHRSCSLGILIVGNRCAGFRSEAFFLFAHGATPSEVEPVIIILDILGISTWRVVRCHL